MLTLTKLRNGKLLINAKWKVFNEGNVLTKAKLFILKRNISKVENNRM
ncbi:MAG: hypothetical protein ACTS6G_04490 [Candidatus Hodgkinia cicadicola]